MKQSKGIHTYYRSTKRPLFRIFLQVMQFFLPRPPGLSILHRRLGRSPPGLGLASIALSLLLFLLILVPFSLNADKANKTEKKELCHYRFSFPPKAHLFSQKQNLFIAKTKYDSRYNNVEIQWLFSCTENLRRTSQSSEIVRKIREEEELLHHRENLYLDQNLEAMLFSRTRVKKGYRLRSIEAYFATRSHEYHFYALARGQNLLQINKKIHSELLEKMKNILQAGKFSKKVEKTITEAQYQIRLYAMIGLFLLLGLLIIFMLSWRVYRRKKIRA